MRISLPGALGVPLGGQLIRLVVGPHAVGAGGTAKTGRCSTALAGRGLGQGSGA